jgi:hypothetical protein
VSYLKIIRESMELLRCAVKNCSTYSYYWYFRSIFLKERMFDVQVKGTEEQKQGNSEVSFFRVST